MFQPNSIETDDDYVATADQYLYVRVDQISAALIDSSRTRELVSFSASDVDVRYSVTSAKTRLAVAVGHIQLDQQSFGTNAQVPVLLSPTPTKFPQPTVQFLAWKDNIRSKLDMDSYEYVAIQVRQEQLFCCILFSIFLQHYLFFSLASRLVNEVTRDGSQN